MAATLAGRVAIVTGAGKGLGRAYALDLAAAGAAVVVNNRRHPGEADEETSAIRTVRAIELAGGRAIANFDDVADAGAGDRMITAALETFGRLDAVVANAGVSIAAPFHKTDMAAFRSVFDPGFFGTLGVAMAAWPHLRSQKYGRLVLTASTAGYFGVHGLAAYSASKGAVLGLMRALAIEGASAGIMVNSILPYAYSQMTAAHMDKAMEQALSPERVAPLVTWLCSEACNVNAEVLVAGGGRIARAAAAETPSMQLDPDGVAASIAALGQRPMQEFPNATAAFLDFIK